MPQPRPILAGAAVFAVTLGAAGIALLGHNHSASAPPFVTSYARTLATTMGDSGFVVGQWVMTTRQTGAQLMSGARVGSNQPAYLVVLQGSFVDRKSYSPSGAVDPSGTTLYFEMDLVTHDVLDSGITSTAPNLVSLGAVHSLALVGRGPGR